MTTPYTEPNLARCMVQGVIDLTPAGLRRKNPPTQLSAITITVMVETETIIKLSLNVLPQLVPLLPLWPETSWSATTA